MQVCYYQNIASIFYFKNLNETNLMKRLMIMLAMFGLTAFAANAERVFNCCLDGVMYRVVYTDNGVLVGYTQYVTGCVGSWCVRVNCYAINTGHVADGTEESILNNEDCLCFDTNDPATNSALCSIINTALANHTVTDIDVIYEDLNSAAQSFMVTYGGYTP